MVDIPSLRSFEWWSAANDMTRVICRAFAAVNGLHHEHDHRIELL